MFAKFPNLEVWVIAQKNDSFCGLRSGVEHHCLIRSIPLLAFAAIDEVYSISMPVVTCPNPLEVHSKISPCY
jgi:hypothetical protein